MVFSPSCSLPLSGSCCTRKKVKMAVGKERKEAGRRRRRHFFSFTFSSFSPPFLSTPSNVSGFMRPPWVLEKKKERRRRNRRKVEIREDGSKNCFRPMYKHTHSTHVWKKGNERASSRTKKERETQRGKKVPFLPVHTSTKKFLLRSLARQPNKGWGRGGRKKRRGQIGFFLFLSSLRWVSVCESQQGGSMYHCTVLHVPYVGTYFAASEFSRYLQISLIVWTILPSMLAIARFPLPPLHASASAVS